MSDDIREVLQVDGSAGRRRRLLWLIPVGLVALGGVALALRPAPVQQWQTEPLTRGDLELEVTAVGTVEPLSQVDIGSEQSGTVVAVHVSANDPVRAGQVLAELDHALLAARVEEARANVATQQANLDKAIAVENQAHRDLERARRLSREGAIAQTEYDQALSAHEQAVASHNLAAAQLRASRVQADIAQINLDKTRIVSPIDGVVLRRDLEPGQAVVPTLGQTYFRVAGDLDHMKVEVEVDEADIDLVRAGQPATFTVPAFDDRTFEAQVLSVDLAPNADAEVVTYDAILGVGNQDKALVPGMSATATVGVQRYEAVLLVPGAALRFAPKDAEPAVLEEGLGRIWVADPDGQPRALSVVLGPTDGRRTLVEGADLREGLPVIVGAAP